MSLRQPVQYPVRYYSYLDAGAPQLADIDGNIKTILKACLVTGYGAKVGAGWTALFEDDYRIVLRRPLLTGNPPDIKIENGVINGTTRHRVVSQDSPIGLDDTNELAAVNLLARDNRLGVEWHLVISDFGFVFCYQMGSGEASYERNNIVYCGSTQKINDADADIFVSSSSSRANSNGTGTFPYQTFLTSTSYLRDMHTAAEYKDWTLLNIAKSEKYFNDDYLVQKLLNQNGFYLPFYTSVTTNVSNKLSAVVDIDDRSMLRFFNKHYETTAFAFYIPLDYWEL